jgi:hypothetical protein
MSCGSHWAVERRVMEQLRRPRWALESACGRAGREVAVERGSDSN